MREKQKKPQILWLSDIHFLNLDEYEENRDVVEKYIKCLKSNILESTYTHIVISGDISFSSQTEEYDSFYDNLLKDIINQEENPAIRVITVPGNHDIDHKTIKEKENIEKFKDLSDLRYPGRKKEINNSLTRNGINEDNDLSRINKNYRSFFRKYISESIKGLVDDKKLEEWDYLNSQGLYGVVYDKEYNIIFNCLNSSWFAFGEDNIIGASFEKLKRVISHKEKSRAYLDQILNVKEYGKLVYGTLQRQNTRLEKLQERERVDECFVISISHHPFSWMDYEIQYNHASRESNFDKIIKFSDVYLCGHQHIRHYAPSKYRGSVNVLESPELMDFKLYMLDNEDYNGRDKRFGFNVLTLNHDLSSVLITQYYTKDKEYYDDEKYSFDKMHQEAFVDNKLNQQRKIIFRKSVIGQFRSWSEVTSYLNKNYKINTRSNIGLPVSINKCKVLIKDLSETGSLSLFEDNLIGEITDKKCIFTVIDIDPFTHKIIGQSLFSKIDRLIKSKLRPYIKQLPSNEYFELNLLFFDLWVYALSCKTEKKINENNYQSNIEHLERFFVKLKHQLFSNVSELKNVALTFEVVNFETYKQYLD